MAIFELFCFLCYYSNMWQFVWSKDGNFYKNSMANLNMHLPWQFWIILFFVLLFTNRAIFLVKNTRAKIEYSLFAIAILIKFFCSTSHSSQFVLSQSMAKLIKVARYFWICTCHEIFAKKNVFCFSIHIHGKFTTRNMTFFWSFLCYLAHMAFFDHFYAFCTLHGKIVIAYGLFWSFLRHGRSTSMVAARGSPFSGEFRPHRAWSSSRRHPLLVGVTAASLCHTGPPSPISPALISPFCSPFSYWMF